MYIFVVVSATDGLVTDVRIIAERSDTIPLSQALLIGQALSETLASNETLCMVHVGDAHE